MNRSNKFLAGKLWVGFFCWFAAAGAYGSVESQWEGFLAERASAAPAIVQNRAIQKTGRLQLWGPFVGTSERKDFYKNYFGSVAGRYHFTERHGWEVVRLLFNSSAETDAAAEVRQQTGYQPDSLTSAFSISTAYVFTPIYGKYAWSETGLVHFELYTTLGGGLRFATTERQPFGELGIGMANYLGSSFSLGPEIRWRIYRETRTESTTVSEAFFQVGAAWLF